MMKKTILIALILALLFTLQPVSANACEGGCDSNPPTTSNDEYVDESYYQLTATNGVYVIEKDGISFYRNNVQIRHWSCKTSENDYLFKDLYGHIYAQIGNRIVHFVGDHIVVDASNIICHHYQDGYFYAFYMVGSDLYFWSPERSCFLAMDVDEAVINHSYGFYRQGDMVYALNTTFYRIANATDEYLENYPVPVVLLGGGTILDYSKELTRGASQQSWDQVEQMFDNYYGLNRYVWG
jgi:hypothetical protein